MKLIKILAVALTLTLAACAQQTAVAPDKASAELSAVLAQYMERNARDNPFSALVSGEKPLAMPDMSYEGAKARAAFARTLLANVKRIDADALSHEEQLTLAMFERQLRLNVEGLDHYWLSFQATPYQAGLLVSNVPKLLGAFDLAVAQDRQDYTAFVGSIAALFDAYREQLEQQQVRGIYLPKPAVPGTKGLYQGLVAPMPLMVTPADERLKGLSSAEKEQFKASVQQVLDTKLLPSLNSLIAVFSDDYIAAAPAQVGLSQYPGGAEAYRYLIKRETTMDLSPAEIHQRGLDYMAKLRAGKAAIRKQLGFTGSEQAFKKKLLADERFYAKTPAEVEQRYQRYMAMIEPKIDDYFSLKPKAPYGFKRLNPAAEATVTFGYYGAPSKKEPTGYYYYNGSKLNERNMIWTQGLAYHETVPGHHFHLALQQENEALPDFRKHGTFTTAFNEGWANYAASLADEMGIMTDPYDRYGWLLFNSFITARLVVDTGMNALGWSREQAIQYMAENTFESDVQIASETIRYSTSIPAQSLAYKLGLEKIWEIRRDMEQRLGDDFDIKKFHAAAVGSGALPMPLLEWHVQKMLLDN